MHSIRFGSSSATHIHPFPTINQHCIVRFGKTVNCLSDAKLEARDKTECERLPLVSA